MSNGWPLVGRVDEVGRVRALLTGGEVRGLVLVGAAGVGKTRVGLAGLDVAAEAGYATVRIAASRAASGLPLAAFSAVLPIGFADGDPSDLLQRAQRSLLESAGGRPLFVLVDDAHLLDPASAALVHQMVTTGAAAVVCTIRLGEPVQDAITALWKDEHVERVDIQPFGPDEVHDLLTTVLGAHVEATLVRDLTARAEGNVLYLRELLLHGLETGNIVDDGGVFRLQGPLAPSQRLVELIGARLDGLDDEERRAVELVALGEPVPSAVCAAAGSADVIGSLERRGIVVTDPDTFDVRLGHPLYGDVVRVGLSGTARRALITTLADATDASGATGPDDGLRTAVWRLDAGDDVAPPVLIGAARRALSLGDADLTLRLATVAAGQVGGFDALDLVGQSQALLGRSREAEETWAGLAGGVLTDEQRLQLLMHRFFNLVGPLGGAEAAMAMVGEQTALLATDAQARSAVAAPLIAILVSEFRFKTVRAHYAEVAQGLTGSAGYLATLGLVMAHLWGGQTNEALRLLDTDAVRNADLSDAPGSFTFLADQARADALLHSGRLTEAEAVAVAVHGRAVAAGEPRSQVWVATIVAKCLLAQGHPVSAARWARAAGDASRQHGYANAMSDDVAQLAQAQALLGQVDDARQTIERYRSERVSGPAYERGLHNAEAALAVAEGRVGAARSLYEGLAAEARSADDWVPESAALHNIARLGGASAVAERLADLAVLVDGELSTIRAQHAAALVVSDGDGLDASSGGFARIGANLLAAEAAADAAAAWRAQGEARRAVASERRCAEMVDLCEGARTPGLTSPVARVALTPAERRVATLAAAGQSNKEIAAELILSVRTVENTLSRAYRALGIASRAELVEALAGP